MPEDKTKVFLLLSTCLEFVFISFEETLFALPFLLFLLLIIVLLQLGRADDQVELGHGDHPWVTVRPVERDLQGDLSNEAWNESTESSDQGRNLRINTSKNVAFVCFNHFFFVPLSMW